MRQLPPTWIERSKETVAKTKDGRILHTMQPSFPSHRGSTFVHSQQDKPSHPKNGRAREHQNVAEGNNKNGGLN